MEYSGHLIFDSAVPRGGGGQMLLFDGGGIFQGATTSAVAVEGARRQRPFLATHEELLVEEEVYYDEQAKEPEKKRRLTPEQVRMLEQSFEEDKRKLEPERKSQLAQRLGMAPRQVAVWFQNRRARWKAKQLEQDFDRLKAAHDALVADRDTLEADNHRLRFEVTSLTEKLQAKEPSTSEIARPEAAVFQLKEDHLTSVLEVAEGTQHGGDSNVTGEEGNNGGTRSSSLTSDDGATAIGNEGGSFFPDAMFVAYTNPLWW